LATRLKFEKLKAPETEPLAYLVWCIETLCPITPVIRLESDGADHPDARRRLRHSDGKPTGLP
jgi:hypothetical protein